MEKKEIEFEKSLTYDELVENLLNKYGAAKYSYFCNESCKTKQSKNMRTKEGLFLHHIGEKEHIMLCNPEFAKKWDFQTYQSSEALVYCNYLEHLLLHVKITSEYMKKQMIKTKEMVGIGGVVNFICPELSAYYEKAPVGGWQETVFNEVKDNFDDYIKICAEFELENPGFNLSKTSEKSSFMGSSIKRIRKAIDEEKKKIKESE